MERLLAQRQASMTSQFVNMESAQASINQQLTYLTKQGF
jgi:flagellar capping protein FliD